MKLIWSLALKDLRLLARDRTGAFFVFAFPILFAVFFGTIFSGSSGEPKRITILIVDLDATPASKAFAQDLLNAEEFNASTLTDQREAEKQVLAGKAVAAIMLPKGFGERQANLFSGTGGATLDVALDPSKNAETGMLIGVLQKYGFMGMARSFQDPGMARNQLAAAKNAAKIAGSALPASFEKFLTDMDKVLADADAAGLKPKSSDGAPAATDATDKSGSGSKGGAGFTPITISSRELHAERAGPNNGYALSFPQATIWGIMNAALGFGTSLVGERIRGTLGRLRCSPLTITQVLLGKAVSCFITVMLVIGLLLVTAHFVFKVTFAEPVSLVMAAVAASTCFVGIMMLVAALSPSERASGGLAWGFLMIMAFLGGAAVPLFVMPMWMQNLSNISPMKWALIAFEGGVWRGTSPADMLLPCGILLAVGVVGFTAGAAAFKRREGV